MTPRQTAQAAIDRALVKASSDAFAELSANRSSEYVGHKFGNAVKHVTDALAGSNESAGSSPPDMPNYDDPWEALAYTQWYSPKQIHLAYSLASDLMDTNSVHVATKKDHQIVDVGCGAYAFSIGLSLAIADRIAEGGSIGQIVVHGIDHQAMLNLGESLWSSLRDEAGREANLARLAIAMRHITPRAHPLSDKSELPDSIHANQSVCRWLVSQHTAYEANQDDVRKMLACSFDRLTPDVGLVTAPDFKEHPLDHINPFGDRPACAPVLVRARLSGVAPRLSEYRAALAEEYNVPYEWLLTSKEVSWHMGSGGAAPIALRYLRI